MKRLSLIVICLLAFACQKNTTPKKTNFWYDIPSEEAKTTTYYFIRHAEKDRSDKTNRDPFLTEKGLERANLWATYFKDHPIEQIFSTNYTRTIQTAIPVASINQLDIKDYKASQDTLFTQSFWKSTYGKKNLIVGHSNTTPKFVNQILGKDKYQNINDSINYKLFRVIVDKELNVKDSIIEVILTL